MRWTATMVLVSILLGGALRARQQEAAPTDLYTAARIGTIPYRWTNGNAWHSLDASAKAAYLVGLQEGIVLSVRQNWDQFPAKDRSQLVKAAENMTLSGVTFANLSEQVDALYLDPQNLNIPVVDAYLYTVQKFRGSSEGQLKDYLEKLRKQYAGTTKPQ